MRSKYAYLYILLDKKNRKKICRKKNLVEIHLTQKCCNVKSASKSKSQMYVVVYFAKLHVHVKASSNFPGSDVNKLTCLTYGT